MSTEIAVITGSSIAGVISAIFLDKLFRIRSNNKNHAQSQSSSIASIREELASLLFEKNLTSEAITRVYEAAQDGRIDRFERDKLLLKYKQQLDSLNQKVLYLQPMADFSDLKELRNNLASFLEDRISALDKKLLELSKSSPPSQDDIGAKAKKILAETSEMQQQSSVTPIQQKMFKADEQSIEQLHKEIAKALQHLERVEIDKD
jgi:DNA repair exonuclease SbcCD ATPase subunit